MTEREIIVDKLRLSYTGLFSVKDLYALIDNWLYEKGYDKRENKNYEVVRPEGKFIELELSPWKKVTDYANNVILIRIIMEDIKEVEVEKDGKKFMLNQGKIKFVFDGILETDWEHRWEGKPIYYFIKVVFDKFIYKPFSKGFETGLQEDLMHLHSQIKGFLNLYRYYT